MISDNVFWFVFLLVSWPFSILCWFNVWKKRDSFLKRAWWTVVILIPFFGPIAYGGLYSPPPVQDKSERAAGFNTSRHGTGEF